MVDFSKLKVVDLKVELKKRGLPQAGLKQALIDRLVEHDSQTSAPENEQSSSLNPEADAPVTPVQVNDTPQQPAGASIADEAPPAIALTPSASDLVDDSRKRKRRSQSPPPSTLDISKKRKQDDKVDSHNEGGTVAVSPQTESNEIDPPTTDLSISQVASQSQTSHLQNPPNQTDTANTDASASSAKEVIPETADGNPADISPSQKETVKASSPIASAPVTLTENVETTTQDTLPSPRPTNKSQEHEPPRQSVETAQREVKDASPTRSPETSAPPAIHPATPALYIREFSRPLQVPALQQHIIALATPPSFQTDDSKDRSSSEPPPTDPTLLKRFHISTLRTHVLLLFSSTNAASRVRAALHNNPWPVERMRKPLWADFVPAEKIEEWIQAETEGELSARGGGSRVGGKKWEVVYHESSNNDGIEAIHQEVGSGGSAQITRRDTNVPQPPKPVAKPQAFVALDSLFSSTIAKPRLYYQSVDRNIADQRMEAFKGSRGRNAKGEMRRYTFEDQDELVDGGEDRRPPSRPNAPSDRFGGRGGWGGRGGGGGYGQGYRGRYGRQRYH